MNNDKYPYYIYPAIQELPEATGEERERLLRRISVGVSTMSALRTVTGIDPEEFRDFYGELDKPELSTDDTISEFIDKFGDSRYADAGMQEDEVPVAPPAVDYASQLAAREELPMEEDETADLLNSFLDMTPAPAPAPTPKTGKVSPAPETKKETPPPAPALGEEALAKIMVKNGNYRKALEIITDLNLKNPKKSVYFADQIRFLQKLIHMQEKSESVNQ